MYDIITNIPYKNIVSAAEILGVTPSHLIGWKNDSIQTVAPSLLSANRIKECRTRNGYTQDALAERLGLQKSAIAKYENGRVSNIKRSTIEEMALLFHCSPAYLMGWEDSNSNSLNQGILPLAQIYETDSFSETELDEIKAFIDFVKSRRK